MFITNYIKHEHRIPETIDKTIDQIMRKNSYRYNKSGALKLVDDFGLIRNIDISDFNLINHHLGNLFEVPDWYKNEYIKYKDSKYNRHFYYICDCCGEFSYEPYCKRCEYEDYRRNLEKYTKDRNFEEAIELIIKYSKES